MNLTHLEYLVTAVRLCSYAEAGRRLHITPQAISKAVIALERELDVPLFTKDGKGVRPTPLALELAARAEHVLDDLSDFRSYASAHRDRPEDGGTLSLGIEGSFYRGSVFGIDDLGPFELQHPNIKLRPLIQTSPFCYAGLSDGFLSAAVTFGKPAVGNAESIRLFSATPRIVFDRRNPAARADAIPLRDVAQLPLAYPVDMAAVYPAIRDAIRATGATPNFQSVEPTPRAFADFLEDGGAVLVAHDPRLLALCPSTVELEVTDDAPLSLPIYLSYVPGRAPACLSLLEDYLLALTSQREQQEHGAR